MDADTAFHYEFPLKVATAEAAAEEDPVRTRVLGRREEALRLLEKLAQTGRLALIPVRQCRQRYLNGLFAAVPEER